MTRAPASAAGARTHGLTVPVAACRGALAAVVALLIVVAYYPFGWDPPRTVHNQVTRTADGALRFGGMNNARTPGTPGWLPEARRSGAVLIRLEAEPGAAGQRASMMMLSSDFWDMDFAIMQQRTDLYVWLRRPGSDVEGDPPFIVGGVLRPHRWTSVDVLLQRGQIRIGVGGRTRLAGPIPADTPRVWGPGQIALGDAVHGGVPWQGRIRLAEVRTGGYAVNYVRQGALSIPPTYMYFPDHVQPFPPTGTAQWLRALADLLTFIPAGFLIVWARRPPVHPVPAAASAAALAVLLAAGKFLFHQRHTSLVNVVAQVLGGLLGAWLAWRLARTSRGASWLRRG